MRTTIEIADDKLIRLKKMAAEQGARGFSRLIDEALEQFFAAGDDSRASRRRRQADAILRLAGTIDEETAERMRESVRDSRRNWRPPSSIQTS